MVASAAILQLSADARRMLAGAQILRKVAFGNSAGKQVCPWWPIEGREEKGV